jgi:hypothetical protein
MAKKCSDPDVDLAAFVFLRGRVAPLFGRCDRGVGVLALYRFGAVLLVQL